MSPAPTHTISPGRSPAGTRSPSAASAPQEADAGASIPTPRGCSSPSPASAPPRPILVEAARRIARAVREHGRVARPAATCTASASMAA
jgi:hypothetical protein